MTEPDDALKAFRKWAHIRFPKCGADIEAGKWDRDDTAHAYCAGAAASAERIKELEAALRSVVDDYDWVRDGPGDRDWNVLDNTIIRARALLKEPDQ